jgi:hypothetical protein
VYTGQLTRTHPATRTGLAVSPELISVTIHPFTHPPAQGARRRAQRFTHVFERRIVVCVGQLTLAL